MKVNRKLVALAAVLLALSALTYWNDARRADSFQRGQKFVSNLNPDEVSQVVIESADGVVTLGRTSDGYQIEEANGYRAKNEAVNRLVRGFLEVTLAKRVGGGASLEEELGFNPLAEDGVEIALLGATGQQMVRTRVGGETEDGTARYVAQVAEDGTLEEIYLSEAQVQLDTEVSDFLRREIVDVTSGQIERIEGVDFVLAKDEAGALALESSGEEDTAETQKLKSALSRLEFDEVFLADAPQVAGLEFSQGLRVDLDDLSAYIVSVADTGDRLYVQLSGQMTVDRVSLSEEDTDEDLQEKSQVLRRSDEINQFNAYHGSWIYALSEAKTEPFRLRLRDLDQ